MTYSCKEKLVLYSKPQPSFFSSFHFYHVSAILTFCFSHRTKQTMLTFGVSNKLDKAICLYYHFLCSYSTAVFWVLFLMNTVGADRSDIILQQKKWQIFFPSKHKSPFYTFYSSCLTEQGTIKSLQAHTVLKMEAFHKESPACVMDHTSYHNRMWCRVHTCILTSIVMALALPS